MCLSAIVAYGAECDRGAEATVVEEEGRVPFDCVVSAFFPATLLRAVGGRMRERISRGTADDGRRVRRAFSLIFDGPKYRRSLFRSIDQTTNNNIYLYAHSQRGEDLTHTHRERKSRKTTSKKPETLEKTKSERGNLGLQEDENCSSVLTFA